MAPTHEPTITNLPVEGAIPVGLSGRLLSIGKDDEADPADNPRHSGNEGVVHSVHLNAGRAMSYRSRRIVMDPVAPQVGPDPSPGSGSSRPDTVAQNIIVFGGTILVLGDRSLAYELNSDLDTVRRVDLAGRSRGVAPSPKRDPITGDLHLLAGDGPGDQVHVVVSSRAFTRSSRPLTGSPTMITDLAITRDHIVFVTDGFVGVVPHSGQADVEWTATSVAAATLVDAYDADDAVIVYALTPSLERWTVHATPATVHRDVLDPAPQDHAHTDDCSADDPPRRLWTTGNGTAVKHDLVTNRRERHVFQPGCEPGDLVFVADATRSADVDGGWIIGLVRCRVRQASYLVVLDAADIARPALATVHLPRRIPRGARSTWILDSR